MVCVGLFPVWDCFASDALSIATDRHSETITLHLKKTSPHKVFTLPSPDRLVVDVPSVGGKPDISLPSGYHGKLISRVRFGQFDPHTWRIAFDLNQIVRVSDQDENDDELVIQLTPSGETVDDAPKARTPEKVEKPAKKTKASSDDNNTDDQQFPVDTKKNITQEAYSGHENKSKSRSSFGKAHSGKPVIMIDPGHGGVDPGTEGPDGTYEKDVVLAYARELRTRLQKTGRYVVKLTRDEDEIVPLRMRVAIARKANASIFISLHADSAPDEVRGLSVYTVSEKSSDEEAGALAARENKADVLTGVNLADEREDVAGILISLAERETKNRSATLADQLVTTLDDKVHLLSNSHRFAGFAVLKAPDVPSVLIEIGFLSHPKEEKLINSKAYREKVTSGIADGVDKYFHVENSGGDQ